MLFEFECPKCHGSHCEIHREGCSDPILSDAYRGWRTSATFAISELTLGQRMPLQILICKSCPDSTRERSYLHCPECDSFHSTSIFDPFGNWHGLICPDCEASIPCNENATARAIRGIVDRILNTSKIGQRNKYVATKKLSANNRRLLLENPDKVPRPNYLLMGFAFGGMLFLVTLLYLAAAAFLLHLSVTAVLYVLGLSFVVTMAGGALFGFGMNKALEQKGDPELHLNVREMIESQDSALISEQSKDSKPE